MDEYEVHRATLAEKVEGEDNLLTSILLRLPPKSVDKFRFVSKRWSNITGESFFHESYKRRIYKCISDGIVAFIQISPTSLGVHGISMLPTTNTASVNIIRNKRKNKPWFVGDQDWGDFINYSHGLILVGRQPEIPWAKLYVVNPLTFESIVVPPPISLNNANLGLAVYRQQDQLTPSFRLVATAIIIPYEQRGNTLPIETYSSHTRKWEKLTLVATGRFSIFGPPKLVVDGVFHWDTPEFQLAVYNSNTPNNHVQLVQRPSNNYRCTIARRSSSSTNPSHDDDDAVLWLAIDDHVDMKMKFWMLPKYGRKRSTTIPKTEWILMHTFTHDFLRTETSRILSLENKNDMIINVGDSFKLEGLIPCDPPASLVVVIRLGERVVFLYNVSTKSFQLVRYRGSCFHHADWIPCMESDCLPSIVCSWKPRRP